MRLNFQAKLIAALGYAVIGGVAFSMIFFRQAPLYLPATKAWGLGWASGWPLLSTWPAFAWIYLAASAALAGAGWALFRHRRLAAAGLVLAGGLLLGGARYFDAADLSNPHHISHFITNDFERPVTLRGTVDEDPDYRERYAFLTLRPEEIVPDARRPGKKTVLSGKTGLVRVTIYPMIGDYYWRASYGDRVEITMPLMSPRDLTNPTGFNYGAYLRARNVYAMSPPYGVRHPEHVRYLGPGRVSLLMKLALHLKKRLISGIRRTIPYPESALFGGITIGLRAGLPPKVNKEFQETGTAHILSVSGLHVSFVYALLLMVCRLFFLPRRVSFGVVVFGLIIFNLITGASPATQRSVWMACMIQGIITFGGLGLRGSAELTLPVAGMVMLLREPGLAPDGSFILSMVAIWALAHLTEPIEQVLRVICRGWKLLVMILFMFAWTAVAALKPSAYLNGWTWTALFGGTALLLAGGARLDRRFPLVGFDFFQLPGWLTGLTIAQVAIVLGMNLPMSALFFQRYSVSGTYANFLAIPLSGVITQLALVAGGFDLAFSAIGLPSAGMFLALCVNAANWYLCRLFQAIMSFFSHHFPYPYIPMPTLGQLMVFYGIVLCLVCWEPLAKAAERTIRWAKTPSRKWVLAGAAVTVMTFLTVRTAFSDSRGRLQVVLFDCGSGNSVLLRTPRGRAILLDGGPVGRGARSFGENVIAPAFAKFNIRTLEAIVVSAPRASVGGGLRFIADRFPVKKVFWPLDPEALRGELSLRGYLAKLGDDYLKARPHDPESIESFALVHDLLSSENFRGGLRRAKAGDVLYEETFGGKTLTLKCLWPPPGGIAGTRDDTGNGSLVLKITFGENSLLYAPLLGQEGEWALVDAAGKELKSDWLVVPGNGNAESSTREFIAKVRPKAAVLQAGYVNWRDRRRYHASPEQVSSVAERYRSRETRVLRTDTAGAVILTGDGENWSVETILKPGDAAVSPAAAPAEAAREISL